MGAEPAGMDIAQLVADHHQAVYRYAYRLTGSSVDAEDMCQHVFLTAQQKLVQLRRAGSARAWLFTTLRNTFLKACRKRSPVLAESLELRIDDIPAEIPDDEGIDRQQLHAAIQELPPEFRIVVLMFYFEDRSYREIASELQLPIGTIMSRLARAKGHLRAKLLSVQEEPQEPPLAGRRA